MTSQKQLSPLKYWFESWFKFQTRFSWMFVIGRQAISISTPPKLMGHMATFALVVSFGTAAAPGAATYRGETTIWEVREGSKIQSPAVVGAPCGSNTTTTTTRTATAATTTTTTTTRLLFCIGVLQKAPIPYVFLIFFRGWEGWKVKSTWGKGTN